MNFFRKLEKISQLHQLIQTEKTGSPEALAKQLNISRSTLYRIIEELKSYDAPVEYSREKETFRYTKHYEFELHYCVKVIDDEDELMKINGGASIFSFRLNFETEGT